MERYIYNQENSLWYELHGDVYLPSISSTEDNALTIGKWGKRYLSYIREHKRMQYTNLISWAYRLSLCLDALPFPVPGRPESVQAYRFWGDLRTDRGF